MSRSEYDSDNYEQYGLWRGAVEAAVRGKRGQAFLKEMLAALDAMPVKELFSKGMLGQSDPIGPENNAYISEVCKRSGLAIAAWGAHGKHLKRDNAVCTMVSNLHYLRLTRDGSPGHPLYLPASLMPIPWSAS